MKVIQPFLKWAGNKRSIIDRITHILPKGERLVEPFCGSAAVFLNTNFKENLICDTNSDLINLYHQLQTDNHKFIKYCEKYFISENNTPEKYYAFRERFNKTKSKKLRAALFLYLNKHGYNGLCRYNKSGQFNVPVGSYKKVTLPRKKMRLFADKTIHAKFLVSDYTTTMENAKKGDVIYCDPPYVPLNESNSSFQYEKNGFSMEQQTLLATLAEETANRGIPVLISNHLTDFTKEIYSRATIISEFSVQRNISCKGDKRTRASEVLALFR
ncbi:MAG: Dam family site-specific DNA-(adenine-N6)-methyltransferase [gamma proteobacterium symbiont of Bathyaustriella thionipta]|nr:Dam family site-specific DNA-(adenine-N6)-methyltransferase [gamma proteobacterium symbiont of Bathyaustriella thionipta]MCU7949927.1 Dam family site-specific DNA-(adenine-N6)-methyltransferase [gamma proteobacterium symbiont of Bathyaustriella thionipta]MCU7954191.1 Dam family site-specific DNA-(adenine-N6)-methyltransferase [gamma proteobacterium symbiont of Bathyaustriella thionipta]MCU7956479.1 Dam family site-specific DNA-(adenine-N6)-methyltransferase [gamma proteobacterium symbiont of 